jgi:peptidoglycan/LPS O-acetylase OafA/YrhL
MVFRILEYPYPPDFGYALTATHLRMEGLIVGFFLAYLSTYWPRYFELLRHLSPHVLVVSFIFMIFLSFANPWVRYSLWGTAVSVFFSSALVAVVSCKEIGIISRVTTPIAISSYSIYLTHALAIDVSRRFVMRFQESVWIAYFPTMLMVVTVSSILFFYGVERTSIRIRDFFSPRRTITTNGIRVASESVV